jgi:twitching motility protein PilT
VPREPPSPEQCGLPGFLVECIQRPQGLILFTGATGQGKTTSQASLLAWLAQRYTRHIVTIEDPVEYDLPQGRAVIDQREVGRDTPSFVSALRRVVRARPDVVMVGEMRDLETIQTVLTLAQTGHVVLSTLHTGDATMAIPRMIEAFPQNAQGLARQELSAALVAVVNQRLVRRKGDGRMTAAVELLINTPAVSRHIREGHFEQIPTAMELDQKSGMRTMNRALEEMVSGGTIDPAEMQRNLVHRESRPSQLPPRG